MEEKCSRLLPADYNAANTILKIYLTWQLINRSLFPEITITNYTLTYFLCSSLEILFLFQLTRSISTSGHCNGVLTNGGGVSSVGDHHHTGVGGHVAAIASHTHPGSPYRSAGKTN